MTKDTEELEDRIALLREAIRICTNNGHVYSMATARCLTAAPTSNERVRDATSKF